MYTAREKKFLILVFIFAPDAIKKLPVMKEIHFHLRIIHNIATQLLLSAGSYWSKQNNF